MFLKNNLLFLLVALLSCNLLDAKLNTEKTLCKGAPDCKNLKNKSCQCWCSVKGGPRDKKPSDRPVYYDVDVNGKHCYCKQWDYDNYPHAPQE